MRRQIERATVDAVGEETTPGQVVPAAAPATASPLIERRRMPAAQSPRHPDFVAVVLEPLARRRAGGESDEALSAELYNAIHPWALAFAGSLYSGLPAHADRNEVLSQVLRLTWDACSRIDWARYAAWPAYLESKVRRARAEAARCDDWLSRRERVRRRTFQAKLAQREQVEQRTLTVSERQAVASAVAPSSTRVDWTKSLLDSRHPSTVADVPDAMDEMTIEEQVEQRELADIRTRCVWEWLKMLTAENESLANELHRWSKQSDAGDRQLPARLAHRLQPYTPILLALLDEAA